MTPLFRLTPYLLLAFLVANVVLFEWFARRTRETSSDEIVQKAYIISRLLSDAAGRAIADDELDALESVVEEAFKDRHIVSVTILDSSKKELYESANNRTVARTSTFETPVKLGGNSVGTLITRFATGEEDVRIVTRLRNTATLQSVLFAAMVMLLAFFCLRERFFRRRVPGRCAESTPSLLPMPAAHVAAIEAGLVAPIPAAHTILLPWHPAPPFVQGTAVIPAIHASRLPAICVSSVPSVVHINSHVPAPSVAKTADCATPLPVQPVRCLPEFTAATTVPGRLPPLLTMVRTAVTCPVGPAASTPVGTEEIAKALPRTYLQSVSKSSGKVPATVVHFSGSADQPAPHFMNACRSLRRAMEILAIEGNRQQWLAAQSRQNLDRVTVWQQQAGEAVTRAGVLIANAEHILTLARGQAPAMAGEGEELSHALQSLNQGFLNAMAMVEQIDALVADGCMVSAGGNRQGCDAAPDSSAAAARELVREGIALLQQRAFPALASAVGAGDAGAAGLSSLLARIGELAGFAGTLSRYGAELSALVEEARQERRPGASGSIPEGEWIDRRQDLLVQRLEALAADFQTDARTLKGVAAAVCAAGDLSRVDVAATRELLVRVGDAVGDATAAMILGGDILCRPGRHTEDVTGSHPRSGELAALARQLHGVRRSLAAEVQAVTARVQLHERLTGEHAQSQTIAGETLRLAGKYLGDLAGDAGRLMTASADTVAGHDGERLVEASIAVELLIGEAYTCLLQFLSSRERHPDAGCED
jgi:hypothetical protein